MKLHSSLDSPKNNSTHFLSEKIEIAGWGFFENTSGCFIEVRLDNRIILMNKFNHHRPDVLQSFPQVKRFNKPVGFKYFITLPENMTEGEHTLSFYIWDDCELKKEASEVTIFVKKMPLEGDFSQRFANIPEKLILKVNGSVSEEAFKNIGNEVVDIIMKNFKRREFKNFKNILDFGCGLGRVLYPLAKKLPEAEFVGIDIDPHMIKWIQYLFSDLNYHFTLSTVDLRSDQFDFIYAISVFTHLNKTTDYWLTEIHRLLKENGYAFLTYHDETLFEERIGTPDIPGVSDKTLLKDCYIVGHDSPEGSEAMGTYYSTPFWLKKLGKYFSIMKNSPRGLFGHQSYTIVSKRKAASDRTQSDREYISLLEKELQKK